MAGRPSRTGPKYGNVTQLAVGLASAMLCISATVAQEQRADGVVDLPAIDVTGENGSGYNPGSTSLSRQPTRILDTPQSVNVVPQQVIQDQKAKSLVEILRNVPGISFNAGEGGTQGDNINIRGYTARNDIYRDGVREPGWYTRDAFSIESVDVLKGPSSFLFGRGSTGGVVNINTKLPKFEDFTEVEIQGSTAPGVRATVDVNRRIGDDMAARIIMMGTNTDTAGRDFVNTKRLGFAPSLTKKFGDSTKVTLSYIYQHDDNIPDYGIILLPGKFFGTKYAQPAPVAGSTFYGQLSPNLRDTEQVDAHIATAKVESELAPGWKATNTTRYSYVDRFTRVRAVQISGTGTNIYMLPIAPIAPAPDPVATSLGSAYIKNTNHFQNHTVNTLITNQSDVTGKFDTGPFKHTLVAGFDIGRETRDNLRTNIINTDRIDATNPNPFPANSGILAPTSAETDSWARSAGVFVNDQVKINRWLELLGGVRYDDYRAGQIGSTITRATEAVSGVVALENKVHFTSWRTGAVVHPFENTSVYFVTGTSFNPPSEFTTITAGQQALAPVTNQTYEIGAKTELMDGKLSVNGAVFRTTKNNDIEVVQAGPPAVYGLVGKTRVQGFEIGITGRITEAWSVFGGYTYLDSAVLQSQTKTNIGHQLANTPKNTFSMFTTYDITRALTAGFGAYYVDKRWTNAANGGLVPAYWRYDAMANYKLNETVSLQLNVYNIANTVNYESLAGAGWAVPGAGRSATLSAKFRF